MREKQKKEKRVLLALSGGVDSSVAAQVLLERGFQVEAVVLALSQAHVPTVEAARQTAGELGISLSVLHREEAFTGQVIEPFCRAYCGGRTPNPCVYCNPGVKFHYLLEEADRRHIFYIASGHYARIGCYQGVPTVQRAASVARDQSYMLYRLPTALRERLLLPLGQYEKEKIRRIAVEKGLRSAGAPDSQEICFIPEGDYAAYMQKQGYIGKKGRLIGPDGEDLGEHRGVHCYTIGQRRGLGLALGRPVFVRRIEPNGDIALAWAGDNLDAGVTLRQVVTFDGNPLPNGREYTVKIRSVARPVACRVQVDNGRTSLLFDEPQRAAAPGQHAVLYDNNFVIGGGEIDSIL